MLWLAWAWAHGQQAGPAASPPPDGQKAGAGAASVDQKLAEARALLASLGDGSVTNTPGGISAEDFIKRRAALRRLVNLYEHQAGNLATVERARNRRAELAREAAAWVRFPDPPPYSLVLTDRLREEIDAEQLRVQSGEAAGAALARIIEENQAILAQAEGRLRQIQEAIEALPAEATRLHARREQERLAAQVAAASIGLLESERLAGEEAVATGRIRLDLLRRQLVVADAAVAFTRDDVDRIVGRANRQREELARELAAIEGRRAEAERAVEAARAGLTAMAGRPANDPLRLPLEEAVAAREAELGTLANAAHALRLMIEGSSLEASLWELRWTVHQSAGARNLREARRQLEALNHRLELWREYARQQMEGGAGELQSQESRLADLPPGAAVLPAVRQRVESLRQRDQMHLRLLRTVESLERLTRRWGEALEKAEGRLPFLGRLSILFAGSGSLIERWWNFELFTAEDTITVDGQKVTGRRSVTFGKIALALLVLGAGYWVIGRGTTLIEPLFVRRFRIEPAQANLIRRWLRAALLGILVLVSLASVKIPLTVFAFAGGALAIGLGFGTQTILKNFVSGLILLFERPFRVGDLIETDGHKGIVTSIGLRASVVQIPDGTEALIPNSTLLEGGVSNHTYSDNKVRHSITVGVAYRSDPRQVVQILKEVAERHGLVEKEPAPAVLFTSFGESTLDFELRVWLDMRRVNAAQVTSDLRLMIFSAFSEQGIRIDYPQRDLHLHTEEPLAVRLVGVDSSGASGSTPSTGGAAP